MQLSGNTIFITGGTSGIGLAFAEEFFRLGNTVIICGRRVDRLAELAKAHPGLVTYVADISSPEERKQLADAVIAGNPTLNVLINNAGMQLHTDLTKPVDPDQVAVEIATNLTAPIHLSSLFARQLQSQPGSAIINISSGLAFTPIAFMPVYCATKAAIHSLSLSMRHQYKDKGVKVFEVAPPSVDTELGYQARTDKSQSHGGIPISEFLKEAMEGLAADAYETIVGAAKRMKAAPEEMFGILNR